MHLHLAALAQQEEAIGLSPMKSQFKPEVRYRLRRHEGSTPSVATNNE